MTPTVLKTAVFSGSWKTEGAEEKECGDVAHAQWWASFWE
jgi:hypothetical protein